MIRDDDPTLRWLARDHIIWPLSKHRECTPLHNALAARLDSDRYPAWGMTETVNAAITRKFWAIGRPHLWWTQFPELATKCIIHNLERILTIPHRGATVRDSERNGLLNGAPTLRTHNRTLSGD